MHHHSSTNSSGDVEYHPSHEFLVGDEPITVTVELSEDDIEQTIRFVECLQEMVGLTEN